MKKLLLLAVIATLFAAGCQLGPGVDLTRLPVLPKVHAINVAFQQRVIAKAIDMTVLQYNFSTWEGQTAYVEINGVLLQPEVKDYIRTSVEAQLSQFGVLVKENPAACIEKNAQNVKMMSECIPNTDLRIIVGVAECGGDEIKKFSNEGGNLYYYQGICRLRVHIIPRKQGNGITIEKNGQCEVEYLQDFYMDFVSQQQLIEKKKQGKK